MECQSYYSNVSFSLSCYISLSCHSFVVEKVFNELEGSVYSLYCSLYYRFDVRVCTRQVK